MVFGSRILLAVISAFSFVAAAEPVADNSFLVEEAYNQEPGVVQFIQSVTKSGRGKGWEYVFINEIPIKSEVNQFSYEIPVMRLDTGDDKEIGDVKLNYRREFLHSDAVVVTGRASLIAPTGDKDKEFGTGALGAEVALITSVKLHPKWAQHFNLGYGHTPDAEEAGVKTDFQTFFWGFSNIYFCSEQLNFMLEVAGRSEGEVGAWTQEVLVSPSVRYGIDYKDWQFVPGFALPIHTVGDGNTQGQVDYLAYFSIEGKLW